MRIMAQVFRAAALGLARQPPKLYLALPEHHGDFRAMPAYLSRPPAAGIKWVNVHERNVRRGLPTVMGLVLLNDPRTGVPLAVMDGTLLTRLRTGAAGGVAARALAQPTSRIVGLVGCGQQAMTQLSALLMTHRLTEVRVWGQQRAEALAFCRRASADLARSGAPLRALPSLRVADTIAECVRQADIVVTTTPSRRALVHRRWLTAGVHINAIGADAPGKRELARDVVQGARIVVDDWVQAAHGGELNVPVREGWLMRRSVAGTLGEVLLGRRPGRRSAQDITIFDSTGLAIQDVALASRAYQVALRRHCGRWIRFS